MLFVLFYIVSQVCWSKVIKNVASTNHIILLLYEETIYI